MIVVVLGSLLVEMLGVYQLLGSLWFWFGHQGWEYLDLGRGWQVLLAAGLGFWLILVIRRIATARKDPQEREISSLFLLAALAAGALNALHLAG
jgi:nitric oxide reductase subunit B